MAVFKKRSSLFIIIAFILILPGIVLGGTILTEPGTCATDEECVCWRTQCWSEDSPEEQFKVGACPDEHCCCEIAYPGEKCLKCWAGVEWEEYKCEAPECERDILVRDCWSYVGGGKCPGECKDEKVCVTCDPIEGELCEECQDWQRPERYPSCIKGAGNDCEKWSRYKKPECLCNGPCLDAPENPRYYNQPLYPLDECTPESEYQMTSNNVYLPVKLDWDDVKGWRDGWKEDKCIRVLDCKTEERACFKESSYNIKACRNDCYNKVLGIPINGYWLSPYKILKFYREECLKNCTIDYRKNNTTDVEGCKEKCPHRDAKKDQDYCYLQKKEPNYKNYIEVPMGDGTFRLLFLEGYAQSYAIKIMDEHYQEGKEKEDYEKGELRDPEAQQKIDVLKALIDHETSISKIVEYEREIEKIKEEELYINSWIEVTRQSEFIPPSPCFLKSNRNYKWKTRICCPLIKEVMSNEDFTKIVESKAVTCPNIIAKMVLDLKRDGVWVEGELDVDCGPWSEEWQFTTNPAPEPKLSYDPDWTDEGRKKNVSYEASRRLEWCEIEDEMLYQRTVWGVEEYYKPLSYKVLVYYWDVNKSEFTCHPDFITDQGKCIPMLLKPDVGKGELLPPEEFLDKHDAFFTKDTIYAWKVAACIDHVGYQCSDFSQEWKLETLPWTLTIKLDGPWDDKETPIGLPVLLKWLSPGANSYRYKISGVGEGKHHTESMILDWPKISLDTVYTWQIQPCLDYKAEDCEANWGGPWHFRTTGRPPKTETMKPTGNNIPIPVNLEWEKVPGAKSFVVEINGKELAPTGEEPRLSLDYPDIRQETDYSWRVKTCARELGQACGIYGSLQSFKTFKLEAPSGRKPEESGTIYTYEPSYSISWKRVSGAKFYKYKVIFISSDPQDPKEECKSLEGEIIGEGMTDRTSVDLSLECWGEYQWQVTACLDENCNELGTEGASWIFSFVAKEAPPETQGWGLIPCGRDTFDPTTPWRETDPCGIEHIFIMLYMVINFFLWKIVPLLLVLLVIASGVIFYFSLQTGATDPLVQVKSIWKAAGIGLAIIFLAWIFISLFLSFFNYQVGLFGPWWRIKLR